MLQDSKEKKKTYDAIVIGSVPSEVGWAQKNSRLPDSKTTRFG